MWIGRADGAGWTFPRATVLAIPLLCLLYVVSRHPWRYNGGIGMYLLDPEQWSEYAADIRVIHLTREKPFVRFKDDLGSGVDPACDDVKHALTEKPFEYWKCVYEEWMLEV